MRARPDTDNAPHGDPEPALSPEQALVRALFDAMPQLGWTARADGFIDYYNRGWYEYTGATYEQMQGWGWQSVHDPRHLPAVLAHWQQALAAGEAVELEFPLRRHDGVFRWFLTRVQPIRNEAGELVRWVGINTDIHDKKVAHEASQAQWARYFTLFSQAPVAIGLLRGPMHVIELANPIMCELWGRSMEEVLGKPVIEALPEIQGQGFDLLLDGVFQSGVAFVGNETAAHLQRTGEDALETRYFNFVYEPMRNDSGRVEGIAVIAVDVTAQVLARQIIAENAKQSVFAARVGTALTTDVPLADQLNRCCEAMVDLGAAFARIWLHNEADGVLELQASAGLYTHLNGPHARVPVGKYKIGLIAEERQPHLTNAVPDDPRVSDPEWARRQGLVAFAGYPLLLGDRLVGVMALFAREALSDETLQALGTVSRQIALAIDRDRVERFREMFIGMLGHDLRNPLGAVLTGAHLLSVHPDVPDGPKRTAGRIENSAVRMSRMVDQLLDYARARSGGGVPIVAAPADLFLICRETVQELKEANPGRTFELHVAGDGRGEWDADRMSQVFSNLLGNAVAYGNPDAAIGVTLQDEGGWISGDVRSVGPSIPAAMLPHIFDPFRRVHAGMATATKGLGLGLFITKEILSAHGGTITASSSPVEGTCFRWSVPRRRGLHGIPGSSEGTP